MVKSTELKVQVDGTLNGAPTTMTIECVDAKGVTFSFDTTAGTTNVRVHCSAADLLSIARLVAVCVEETPRPRKAPVGGGGSSSPGVPFEERSAGFEDVGKPR